MMAADFFMSARARGLRVAPRIDALGEDTIRHLTWRFSRFYGDRKMLKTMVGCVTCFISFVVYMFYEVMNIERVT